MHKQCTRFLLAISVDIAKKCLKEWGGGGGGGGGGNIS